MSGQDSEEAWSSEGDSFSSDSLSSDSETTNILGNYDKQACGGATYLNRSGIYTEEEVIEQAIKSCSKNLRLCKQAMTLLRETMVDSYVKEAVEAKPDSTEVFRTNKALAPSDASASLNCLPSVNRNYQSAELRALRRFGRLPNRAGNAKQLTVESKFAIMSTHCAPWTRSGGGGGQQTCKYRDPTTTTWETRCHRPPLPLLPYCATHLVLSDSSTGPVGVSTGAAAAGGQAMPQPPPTAPFYVPVSASAGAVAPLGDTEAAFVVEGDETPTAGGSGGKQYKAPAKKQVSSKSRSMSESAASSSDVQCPPQYLFRKCGGGPNNDCSEPVIAWAETSRCPKHENINTIFSNVLATVKPKQEDFPDRVVSVEDREPSTPSFQISHRQSSSVHPLLRSYLDQRPHN